MDASTRAKRLSAVAESPSPTAMIDPDELINIERRLRVAFVARYGIAVAEDLTQECLTWAWANRSKVLAMENPIGYLYRVGQSRSRRLLRWRREPVRFPAEVASEQSTWTEPALPAALASLTHHQRTSVVLTQCFQWTYAEVAELLDVPQHTVRNGVHRGLTNLRTALGTDLS